MPYIVAAGTGVVRRAAAARDKGMKALEPTNLRTAFLTHPHADHTLGLPDLILTPWIMGRKEPAGAVWSRGNTRDGGAHSAGLRCRHKDANRRSVTLEPPGVQGERPRHYTSRRV